MSKFKLRNKPQYILAEEPAMEVLEKIFDYYEIDPENLGDKKLQKAMDSSFERSLKAVRLGRLDVTTGADDKNSIVQYPRSGTESGILEYEVLCGRHKMTMGDVKEDDHYGKIYALTAAMTKLPRSAIEGLTGVDLSLVEVLGAIFLSV